MFQIKLPEWKNMFSVTTTEPEKVVLEHSFITGTEGFNAAVVNVLNELFKVLSNSYGPNGSNTVINNRNDTPIITKDGYTILKNINFYNTIESDIHKLILKISQNLVNTVGDGSTSAVLSASMLYKHLQEVSLTFNNRKEFIDIVNRLAELITIEINKSYSHKVTPQNRNKIISTVAALSNNNDANIGKAIATLFQNIPDSSSIKIVDSPLDEPGITHRINYGFTYNVSPIHMSYLGKSPFISINDPIIFSSYEFFEAHYKKLEEKVIKVFPDCPVIIIADIIDSVTSVLMIGEFLKGKKIYVIKSSDLSADYNHQEFIDLNIYLDSNFVGDIIKDDWSLDELGSCKSVDIYPSKVVFNNGQGLVNNTEIFQDRIKTLSESYEECSDNEPSKKGRFKIRLDKLNGVNVTLYVGGRTAEEKATARFLVEDSIFAVKSTLEKGYTFGGNITPFYASADIFKCIEEYIPTDPVLKEFDVPPEVIIDILEKITNAYFELVSTFIILDDQEYQEDVLTNLETSNIHVFNLKKNVLETIEETTVIAPVETDIEIVKATFSIVMLLLSTNQYISN